MVILVARETCSYSRKFIPKIHKVALDHNLKIYFIHDYDFRYRDEIMMFREKYYMPTVPSLLYSNQNRVDTVSDSSLSETEIAAFIESK